jgi:hypothetical protein
MRRPISLRLLLTIGAAAIGCSRPAPAPAPAAPAAPIVVGAVMDAGGDAALVASPEPEPEPPEPAVRPDAGAETVTIKLVADERKKAHVFWGRKELGVAPLEVTRPRGSGPMDLLVIADGYLPLHTRVFTDRNETLALRVFDRAEAARLPGYSAAESSPESSKTTGKMTGKSKPGTTTKPRPLMSR